MEEGMAGPSFFEVSDLTIFAILNSAKTAFASVWKKDIAFLMTLIFLPDEQMLDKNLNKMIQATRSQ